MSNNTQIAERNRIKGYSIWGLSKWGNENQFEKVRQV